MTYHESSLTAITCALHYLLFVRYITSWLWTSTMGCASLRNWLPSNTILGFVYIQTWRNHYTHLKSVLVPGCSNPLALVHLFWIKLPMSQAKFASKLPDNWLDSRKMESLMKFLCTFNTYHDIQYNGWNKKLPRGIKRSENWLEFSTFPLRPCGAHLSLCAEEMVVEELTMQVLHIKRLVWPRNCVNVTSQ